MKRGFYLLLSVCLILCVVLSGCGLWGRGFAGTLVPYDQMEYSRPDMVHFDSVLEQSCEAALSEQDIRVLEDEIWNFYEVYDGFYTNYGLAMIEYSRNLSDIYWQGEYQFCTSNGATVDAGLDRLYRCLAKSPLRETLEGENYFGPNYFDSFEGESIYDEELTRLLNEEGMLRAQYQAICAESSAVVYYSEEYFQIYGSQMAQLFVELVQLRQEIAEYAGFGNYLDFAYQFYHIRDYTPQDAVAYLADIRAELVPLYVQMEESGFWDREFSICTEDDTWNYLRDVTAKMGGTIATAFSDMETAGVYDISYHENKYPVSFEIYLANYRTPYVFLSPTGTEYDQLAFAHEFGHFCTDYVMLGGSMQSVDVSEVFSQGMEYLSVLYADGADDLVQLKMADCLRVYVEQAAYASFEHQVYELPHEELTEENIAQLYQDICVSYGMDSPGWDSRDYVCIPHFYESPLYIISYVLSNDVALQIYQMELQTPGSGLACYENNLTSTQPYLLTFVAEAGLESPFAIGRLIGVRDTLESVLLSL